MNQKNINKTESNTSGKSITFCVKCESDNISVNDKGYVCHNCRTRGTFEWYETPKD